MSHKTMIDGVAYEISGGKTLVDGTAYSIKNGKTLVDGTVYEVGFATNVSVIIIPPKMGVITGTRSNNADYASVTIDGVVYDGSEELTLTVPRGTIIKAFVSAENYFTTMKGYVYFDEVLVLEVEQPGGTYELVAECDTEIAIYADTCFGTQGHVRIYTENHPLYKGP